jgi:hypothetical protein
LRSASCRSAERYRELHPNAPRWPEGSLKGAQRELDGYRVTAALRLPDYELPAQ